MQNTIPARRISYDLIAVTTLLVVIALLVGFATGLTFTKPSSISTSPAVAQPNAPTSGWVYQRDSVTQKWYLYHYNITSADPVVDAIIELQKAPAPSGGCKLDLPDSDC